MYPWPWYLHIVLSYCGIRNYILSCLTMSETEVNLATFQENLYYNEGYCFVSLCQRESAEYSEMHWARLWIKLTLIQFDSFVYHEFSHSLHSKKKKICSVRVPWSSLWIQVFKQMGYCQSFNCVPDIVDPFLDSAETETHEPVKEFEKILQKYEQQFTPKWLGLSGSDHTPRYSWVYLVVTEMLFCWGLCHRKYWRMSGNIWIYCEREEKSMISICLILCLGI